MTVGAAMQSAALRISGTRPASFYGNSQQLAVELCDLVNEVAQDVASYQDWQALTKVATLPVDGLTTEFDLPSDYEAMLLASNITDLSNWFWNYFHVTDVNQFL